MQTFHMLKILQSIKSVSYWMLLAVAREAVIGSKEMMTDATESKYLGI